MQSNEGELQSKRRGLADLQWRPWAVLLVLGGLWLWWSAPSPSQPAATAVQKPLPQVVPQVAATPRRNYALTDGGRYGYERRLSEEELRRGQVSAPVLMIAYNGIRDGTHQLMPYTDEDLRAGMPYWIATFEWRPGDEFYVKRMFREGKFHSKEFLRALPGSVVMLAMQDAENGHLQRFAVPLRDNPKRRIYPRCLEDRGCVGDPA